MNTTRAIHKLFTGMLLSVAVSLIATPGAFARDIEYKSGEVTVNVTPGEPTQIMFPDEIQGGFKKTLSSLHLDRKDSDLIVFATEGLSDTGEAIIVRLKDGRSYSIRVRLADSVNPRDDVVNVYDDRAAYVDPEEGGPRPYEEKKFGYAPSTTVSGLMREMILVAEFGKKNISGYKESDRYQGEAVMSDGTMQATIDRIFIGPNLWGYVLNAKNMLDQSQQLNPASFRLDGTRAVSASSWELSPRPMNIEQQIAGSDSSKVYVITRAKKTR